MSSENIMAWGAKGYSSSGGKTRTYRHQTGTLDHETTESLFFNALNIGYMYDILIDPGHTSPKFIDITVKPP